MIPAFNESHRIRRSLDHLQQFLARQQWWKHIEVIVVADGCTDDTPELVLNHRATFPALRLISYPKNRGKGFALKTGVAKSQGRLVLVTDADFSTPIEELPRLARFIELEQAEIVIGSRRADDAKIMLKQPLHRRVMGTTLSLFTRTVTGLPFRDTQCGFKLFSGSVARRLFSTLECDHFGYDLHILHRAMTGGERIIECGITWTDSAGSRVRPLADGWKILASAWALRFPSRTAASLSIREPDPFLPSEC